ncbi:hypothetical protein HHL16_09245 [Pseudoflavitalea sp. G-6-1-2]|uniref:hypothetical protein n=1 Tax=Pseudoflavitalea sp. G-6-1-2 TaxID=2728841 RepID=UPI00146A171E|nr:hypothetical protein [Pseudoflavitalea sp. G-6-1-2]NML21057.1 hypothetical protein [Pseudoflavitalea sp. G-6-1-2]
MKKSNEENKQTTPQQNQTDKPIPKSAKPSKPDSIELPDVEDIPGQEHIRPPKLREFNDVTASSAGEEGSGIFDDEDDELLDDDSDVSPEEKELLDEAGDYDPDDEALRRGRLDEVDDEGDPLNESDDYAGDDLDVPGSEDDDADEAAGSEDEANNQWSVDKENEEEDPNANSNI